MDENLTNTQQTDEEEITIYRALDKPFTCSDCVCVEYIDCINLAYIPLLLNLIDSEVEDDFPFDIDKIRCFNELPSMLDWYMHRKHRNPLLDLLKEEYEDMDESEAQEFIDNELSKFPEYTEIELDTPVLEILHSFINNDLAKRYIIFHDHYDKNIEDWISGEFNDKVEFLYGDFEDDIIDNIPDVNCTYFLSDIDKINTLIDKDKNDYNSIILGIDFDYNKDENGDLLLDFDEIEKFHLFRYAFMNYCE